MAHESFVYKLRHPAAYGMPFADNYLILVRNRYLITDSDEMHVLLFTNRLFCFTYGDSFNEKTARAIVLLSQWY